jgi:hypothetical protein
MDRATVSGFVTLAMGLGGLGCGGEAPAVASPIAASAASAVAASAASSAPVPAAAPTASASAAAVVGPTPPASAAPATPPAPAPKSAGEILASLPDKAGTMDLGNGLKITVDAAGRVVIEDPNGKNGGSSHCGGNGFVYRKSVQLFAELQDALRAGAKNKVADLVLYPLRINEAVGKFTKIKDRAELLAGFERAFPEKVVAAILAAEPRAIFCRADGFMLGPGTVWANVQKGRYGLFVINP